MFFRFLTMLFKMEAKMDQLRTLVEAADRDKVELLNQLEEERRYGFTQSPVTVTYHNVVS